MKKISIKVGVYARELGSIYRIYVNNILMTERTAWWNVDQSYVEEEIIVNVKEGSSVKIKIETIGDTKRKCKIKNIRVDGEESTEAFVA